MELATITEPTTTTGSATVDLGTTYLGLPLAHPLMSGASPLAADFDAVRQLEDAGAAAIVLPSLFEEEVGGEASKPDEYLEHLLRTRAAVDVPVIASLNGTAAGDWLRFAQLMEEAGAAALELNFYQLTTDPDAGSGAVEERTLEMVRTVRGALEIPLAVKLSPFYTSLPHFAHALTAAGVDGLVLFNRLYQADLDVETLAPEPALRLSDSSELLLRLRWLAILSGQVDASLAVSGGVHGPLDAIKAVMSGAHAVQMVSALLEVGPRYLRTVRREMGRWMEAHGYRTLAELRGRMNLAAAEDPHAAERAHYRHILRSWG